MRAIITIALCLLATTTHAETVEVVRSSLGSVSLWEPGAPLTELSPLSPTQFGLTTGRIRYLAASESVGAVIVEVVGQDEGGLFALPVGGGQPVRLGPARGAGFDPVLSPDGRWLAFPEGERLRIVYLTLDAGDARELTLVDPHFQKEQRIENVRWLDATRVAFEREHVRKAGTSLMIDARIETVDMLGQWRVLVPNKRTQDRLAAVLADDRVLLYRDGDLWLHDPTAAAGQRLTSISAHTYDGLVIGRLGAKAGDGALLARGGGGLIRDNFFQLVDGRGVLRDLTPKLRLYADPILAAHQGVVWVTVQRGDTWAVEAIDLTDGTHRRVDASARPTILTHTFGDRAVGCRGDDIMVFGRGAQRVLATSRGLPSCTIRGVLDTARGPVVVFEAKGERAFITTAAALDGGGTWALDAPASHAGLIAGRVVVHGYNPSARIVAGGRTVVPWTMRGIVAAQLSPDGQTVVYRHDDTGPWYAARVDGSGPRRIAPAAMSLGLTNDRLVMHDLGKVVSARFDGRDVASPIVCLDDAFIVSRVAPRAGRVAAMHGAHDRGQVTFVSVAVDGSERRSPKPLASDPTYHTIALDPVHERVVYQARGGVWSAAIDGSTPPIQLTVETGDPVTAQPSALHRVDVAPNTGNALLIYATTHTAMPHTVRVDAVRTNGSGARTLGRDEWPGRRYPVVVDDHTGREAREVLVPGR